MKNELKHLAIILDGNGRWAKERGMIRTKGHEAGYKNIEPISLYCQNKGVKVLSLYCFSTENWNRPDDEVGYLMDIPSLLIKNIDRYKKNNIQIIVSGRKDRFPDKTKKSLDALIERTKDCTGMMLNICFDYGSLNDIANAIKKIKESNEEVNDDTIYKYLSTSNFPKVDLLIRPGGEKRLSNFLLLECAYAELLFVDKYWPDFNEEDLDNAFREFENRNRRYGGIKK